MLRRNVHGAYALKVDMSLYSEKYPELGKYRYGTILFQEVGHRQPACRI